MLPRHGRREKLYEPVRGSWAQVREDLRRRQAFRRTLRMSEESSMKLADLLPNALERNEYSGSEYHSSVLVRTSLVFLI